MDRSEIKWFCELTTEFGQETDGAMELWFAVLKSTREFCADPARVEAAMRFFSLFVFDKPNAISQMFSSFSFSENIDRKTAIQAFSEQDHVMGMVPKKWIPEDCHQLVPSSELIISVERRSKFCFRIPASAYALMLTENLVTELEPKWLKDLVESVASHLNDKNYKTPRQFSEDWDIPLRETNRSIKKLWNGSDTGSIKMDFPGMDSVILLSPAFENRLKLFTPSGKAAQATWFANLLVLSQRYADECNASTGTDTRRCS